ncbi:MAG TPA: DUF2637 domain-containing protein [Kineosporiaceae bacterium]|nr:DUF2637 domain-containing protein [Kineosporiaceae bacterium]
MAEVSDLRVSAEQAARQARRLGFWARVVLVPVAVIGAVLSFRSLYQAAVPTFGDYLAAGFPLLVDLLILGASLQYVAGAKIGRPMAGWRLTAHAGVAGTLVLNALAAKELGEVPWHVTAPAVWAVLVELTAKQVLGEWKATHTARADTISLPLWMTAPIESVRTRLLMFRTGITDAHRARIAVGVNAAAREALRLALPKRNARRVRRIINRQLRAGSLTPVAILRPLGWTKGGVILNNARPEVILQAVLQEVLDPGAPTQAEASAEAGRVQSAETGSAAAVAAVAAAQPVHLVHPVDPREIEIPEPEPEFEFEAEFAADPQPQPMGWPRAQPPQYRVDGPTRTAQPTRAFQPTRPVGYPGPAPQPGLAPHSEMTSQQAVAPEVGPHPGAAPQSEAAQPDGASRRPGTVQQPARALQLGRALHRGRVLHQTGTTDASSTTAEQLRSELTRLQNPRFEPPQFEPEGASTLRAPAAQPQQPDHQMEQPRRVDQQTTDRWAVQATRPVEPFLAQTAVIGLDRQSDGRRGVAHLDETEVLEDMEHLDELDGQYPDGFNGLDRNDYIDLDDPSRQGRPVPRGTRQ